ncbi:NnrS family protein [Pseudoalteromonas sp. L1]|uniref:NnrS family protein n=1 Tax=Pseudoalteromonas sp. L1 TaxID=195716 RepID=UPI001F20C6CC|nr:NnrS family protein [Pseudoalteromonas sp. L1]
MRNHANKEQVKTESVFFQLAFRPLFFAGGLFSCIALVVWGLVLHGKLLFSPYGGVLFWHSHEMLFGFVCAVIVGFLLTAVQNWTGVRSIHGKKLLLLTSLWLLARIAMVLPFVPKWCVFVIDMSFLPLAGYWLAQPIILKGQMRNLFFVPILLMLSATNLLMHLGVVLGVFELYQHGYMSAILLITLLMSVLGGRVIPFFTANATQTKKVVGKAWLEIAALGSTWGMFFLYFCGLIYYIADEVVGVLFVICALLHCLRAARWHFFKTLSIPLLWSLHLAYWFIPLGILLMGAAYLFELLSISTAFHALTVGAMGNMILSMMSRVSLGHTGRKLIVKHAIIFAFGAVLVAALLRVFGVLIDAELTLYFISLSVITWCIAYGLFSLVYFPVLTQPRVDEQSK